MNAEKIESAIKTTWEGGTLPEDDVPVEELMELLKRLDEKLKARRESECQQDG